jgi:hypothetical protein
VWQDRPEKPGCPHGSHTKTAHLRHSLGIFPILLPLEYVGLPRIVGVRLADADHVEDWTVNSRTIQAKTRFARAGFVHPRCLAGARKESTSVAFRAFPPLMANPPTANVPFARCTRSRQICWPQTWRRGWDLNPVGELKARNLLILRAAPDAGTARTARVGYSLGTDRLARLASRLLPLLPPLALLSPLVLAQELSVHYQWSKLFAAIRRPPLASISPHKHDLLRTPTSVSTRKKRFLRNMSVRDAVFLAKK